MNIKKEEIKSTFYRLIPVYESVILIPQGNIAKILSIKTSNNEELLNTEHIKSIDLENGVILLKKNVSDYYTVETCGKVIDIIGVSRGYSNKYKNV